MTDPADAVRPAQFRVRFATDAAGRQPARDYLEQDCAGGDRVQILRRCEYLAASGRVANREQFRQIEGPIFEVKAHQARGSCYWDGMTWWLLLGFTKKQDKWPMAELERAKQIMREHEGMSG